MYLIWAKSTSHGEVERPNGGCSNRVANNHFVSRRVLSPICLPPSHPSLLMGSVRAKQRVMCVVCVVMCVCVLICDSSGVVGLGGRRSTARQYRANFQGPL